MSSEAATYFPSSTDVRTPALDAVQVADNANTESRLLNPALPIAEWSDELLLEQVSRGNREALGLLFRRHATVVRNVAKRILRHEAEADDLVQDVFIFVFRRAAIFNAKHGTARSWIVQVTYHRAFDKRSYLKKRHFYTSRDLELVMLTAAQRRSEADFVEWTLEGVWGKESAARLRELLSPAQLITIQLHFFEGYTLEEVADRLGQTLLHVRHHYYRGLQKLRRPAFAGKLRSR